MVQTAVAKGKFLYDTSFMAGSPLTQSSLPDLAETDAPIMELLDGAEYGFVSAVRLSYGEARPWRDKGCLHNNCAHVTYYDYESGGTINAVLTLEDGAAISRWKDADARPGGSADILQRAMAVAAADGEVRAILGELSEPAPAMIPMSGWLADDACSREWCVDLTYHDPEGSGRILHIFVNLETEQVARTFFSRGRAARSKPDPISQRNAFQDDCIDQYGWNVCWEMTAHDGVNFRDATYQGQTIFASVKIGQVEAWYPSWPGGYRDEIGFAASVPPFGGTNVVDLGDGIEVSQLFTEFTHWPNCICCYRYEQIMRFFMDGTLEFEFVSHGPGCDDVPSYRPFWRIDIDLDGPENDEVWIWETDQWAQASSERELHPFVEDISPDGYRIATIDGDLNYRWRMLRTDPLERDESRFFVLRYDPLQGDGPIVAGPGDTYQPPRQWMGEEPLSGENVVLWFVPILKQLQGGPWWCMPDPDPDYNPCNTILRAEPGGPLHQPTAEELEQLRATPTPEPTPELSPSATAEAVTASTLDPTPTLPARTLDADDAETIIMGAGCGSCHALGSLGEERKVGPDLSSIGRIAGARVEGMSAEDYLRASILDPNAYIVPDCPNGPCLANIMPRDYGSFLSTDQVELLIDFLITQMAEPAAAGIIGAESGSTEPTPSPKAFPAPKRSGGRTTGDADPSLTVQLLLLSMVFLLTLFRLLKQPDPVDEG